MIIIDYDSDYLSHYGVKGMKWGVRKEPQKKLKSTSKSVAKFKNDYIKKDRAYASKHRRNLSDDDLSKRVKRLEQEQKLKKLTDQDIHPGRQKIKEFGKYTIGAVGTVALSAGSKYVASRLFEGKIPTNKSQFIRGIKNTGAHIGKALRVIKKK